jgi:hypothetical protein
VRYGWRSEKARAACGSVFWSTPDGGEVEVTAVSDSRDYPEYKWDDKVYVGEVVRWLRGRVLRILVWTVSTCRRTHREDTDRRALETGGWPE